MYCIIVYVTAFKILLKIKFRKSPSIEKVPKNNKEL